MFVCYLHHFSFDTTAADCKEIVDAEMASGKHLVQVGFMRRYDRGYNQVRDLIRSGENGFLVPADEPEAIAAAVQRCIDDAQLAEAIARRGSDAARQLTWAANADAYLTLFTQLIATSSKGVS